MTVRIEQRNLKRRHPEEPKDLAFGGAWVVVLRGWLAVADGVDKSDSFPEQAGSSLAIH
jgi:hypothetical protein